MNAFMLDHEAERAMISITKSKAALERLLKVAGVLEHFGRVVRDFAGFHWSEALGPE